MQQEITRNDFILTLICVQTTKITHLAGTIPSSIFYSDMEGKKSEGKKNWNMIQRKPHLNRNCIDQNALYEIRR